MFSMRSNNGIPQSTEQSEHWQALKPQLPDITAWLP
jgi:hypothetical protein